MPLSKKDLADIAKEFAAAKAESDSAKSGLPDIQKQIAEKEEAARRQYILYNRSNGEIVVPYEQEQRWLNGLTRTPITQTQIDDAAVRAPGNIFFPTSWSKNNAQLTANANGNPTTNSPNSESYQINESLENSGLIATVNLLLNGQSSSVSSDNLDNSYNPGDAIIRVDNGGQTVGQLLYISGSGTSALVRVTSSSGKNIGISEIIPPQNPISIGGTVIQNIPGFSNANRQTLTSGTYQNILTQLTNRISVSAALWNTALNNQLSQLSINVDNAMQTNTAKANVQSALTSYSTWNAFPNTGVTGKFTDASLPILTNAYTTRNSQIPTRIAQIVANLGSVSQNSKGDYSGSGQYLQRFKCLNYLINGANGPQYQIYAIGQAKAGQEDKITNNADKLATYSSVVRYAAVTEGSNGTSTVKFDNVSQFSVSDTVLLTGDNLPTFEVTIVNISGNSVTFNLNIPEQYTKQTKSGMIKSA